MASHPRIVVPILVFLLGTLSYVVRTISSSCESVILIASAKSDFRSNSDSCCAGQGIELVGFRRYTSGLFARDSPSSLRTIDFKIVQWLRRNTLDRVGFFRKAPPSLAASEDHENLWKDREEAEKALRSYLVEAPSEFTADQIPVVSDILHTGTIAFVHGPQGSGKSSMLNRALKDTNRYVTLSSNPNIADLYL